MHTHQTGSPKPAADPIFASVHLICIRSVLRSFVANSNSRCSVDSRVASQERKAQTSPCLLVFGLPITAQYYDPDTA